MAQTRIILADDHILIRSGLKLLLQNDESLKVVGEASDGLETVRLVESLHPDMVLLDLSMPGMDGLACLKEIKNRELRSKIIVLTMHEDESYIKEAMQAGADGYVQKSAVDTELFCAIKQVLEGNIYLNSRDSKALLSMLLLRKDKLQDDQDPYILLSPREREVLRLQVRGYSLKEVSDELGLSVKTIDTYKTRIMEKLNFTKKSELISYALKYGLLRDK